MTVDPRISTIPGRSTSRLTGQADIAAPSAARYVPGGGQGPFMCASLASRFNVYLQTLTRLLWRPPRCLYLCGRLSSLPPPLIQNSYPSSFPWSHPCGGLRWKWARSLWRISSPREPRRGIFVWLSSCLHDRSIRFYVYDLYPSKSVRHEQTAEDQVNCGRR